MTTLNINQFAQSPVRGMLDLAIMKSGVISGFSTDVSNTLHPGDRVKLDSTNITAVPAFLKAAITEDAIGTVAYSVRNSSVVAGQPLEITLPGGCAVQYQEGGETLLPGAAVEFNSSDQVITFASGASKKTGIVLDKLTSGSLGRVLMTPNVL